MIILNTQGIVLKAVRYKENDVILTLFTRKLGKVSAIAKGAKRNKSSLLSSAQLFSYANYTLKRNEPTLGISNECMDNPYVEIKSGGFLVISSMEDHENL